MKLKCILVFFISFASWQIAFSQYIEFTVKSPTNKSLPGALLLRLNNIVAISDTAGIIRLSSSADNFRLHLAGYRDTMVSISLINKKFVMQPSGQAVIPVKLDTASNLHVINSVKYNDLTIFSTDYTTPADSVLEKVTQISVKWPCVIGIFKLPVSSFYAKYYEDFEMALYEDKEGKPGASLLSQRIPAYFYNNTMIFNLFDYQIFLKTGSYFIGYRKKVHHQTVKNTTEKFLPNLIDLKISKGATTYRKVNNTVWLPVSMPKSTETKPKYYSFAYSLQLVTNENLD